MRTIASHPHYDSNAATATIQDGCDFSPRRDVACDVSGSLSARRGEDVMSSTCNKLAHAMAKFYESYELVSRTKVFETKAGGNDRSYRK